MNTETANATDKLCDSAFDFLRRSIDEIETHPKYSVIHFATAIELLLKARLMSEHWSIVVERSSDAELRDFLGGRSRTVSTKEAIKRIDKICGQPLRAEEADAFLKLADHRNRMIHFYHEAIEGDEPENEVENIFKEQCRCWYYLKGLLIKWGGQFNKYSSEISSVSYLMNQNRDFLNIAYSVVLSRIEELKKSGRVFCECPSCGLEAALVEAQSEVLFYAECLVCGLGHSFAEIGCPNGCDDQIKIETLDGIFAQCNQCGEKITPDTLSEVVNTEPITSDNYFDHREINCADCMSGGWVVPHNNLYVCCVCLATSEAVSWCEWCNEGQLGGGDLEMSYLQGCEFCDGKMGWEKDN